MVKSTSNIEWSNIEKNNQTLNSLIYFKENLLLSEYNKALENHMANTELHKICNIIENTQRKK
jgi:hypothetical protein